MISWKIRLVVILVLFIGLATIVNLIRKRSLELKYALIWLLLGAALLIVVMIPGLLEWFSLLAGISNPMSMVFFMGFLFLIAVIFVLTMSISNNSNRVRKMAQKIALNEYLIHKELEKK